MKKGLEGLLESHVPELLQKKGWTAKEFAARFMLAGGSQDVAYRMARGESNFYMASIALAALVLGEETTTAIIDLKKGATGA